jgi:hypothetical protein
MPRTTPVGHPEGCREAAGSSHGVSRGERGDAANHAWVGHRRDCGEVANPRWVRRPKGMRRSRDPRWVGTKEAAKRQPTLGRSPGKRGEAATTLGRSSKGMRRSRETTLGRAPKVTPRSGGNLAGSGSHRTVGGLGGSAPQHDDGGEAARRRQPASSHMETPQCCQVGGPPALRGQLGHREGLRGRYSVTKKVLSSTGDPWSGAGP